jgi:signal transduction histidine kinase
MDLAGWISSAGAAVRNLWGHRPPARIAAPLFCLFIVLAAASSGDGALEISRNWVFDTYQRLEPADRSNAQTILIDIDAESLRRIGQWPWPRDQLARLLDAVAGARVVGLDLLLIEPDRMSPGAWVADRPDLAPAVKQSLLDLPGTDEALAASMARTPVILAAIADRAESASQAVRPITPVLVSDGDAEAKLPRYSRVAWPLPILAKAAAGIGLVSVLPEPDGIMRRLPVIAAIDGTLVPSFAAEILRAAAGSDHIGWRATLFGERDAVIGDRLIPTDLSGRVWPRYGGKGLRARTIPAYQILGGTIPPSEFRGRIVLIGAGAAGLADVAMTPLRRPETGMMVQANLIESMLAGDTLRRPAAALVLELFVALALGVAATLLIGRLTDLAYLSLFGGIAILLVIGPFAVFEVTGLLLDWTLPITALAATMLVAFAARIHEEAIARHQYALDLAAALFQAEAADRAKTEFLANASHELRTPLTAIIGFSEIMAAELFGPLSKTYADYSRDIHTSATHLLSIISDILDLSVIDMGGRQPVDDRVDIARLAAECQRMILPRAADRRVSFVTTMPVPVPTLLADVRMVRQMLLNLLSNAIKYSPPDGIVIVTIILDTEGWLCLSVQDRGHGISAADLPHVMQRFARLRSATLAQEPGIGIGLPLTKSMIELHGGKLEIKSEIEAGTEVILRFPPARLTSTKETSECEDAQQCS